MNVPLKICLSFSNKFILMAILVFNAFGHRDLAKQVTLKEHLSGNLNTRVFLKGHFEKK